MKLHTIMIGPKELDRVILQKIKEGFAVYLFQEIPAYLGMTRPTTMYLVTFFENAK